MLGHRIPERNGTHVPKSLMGGKFKASSQSLPKETIEEID